MVISADYANISIMFFRSIKHDPIKKITEIGGLQKASLTYSKALYVLASHTAIHLDRTFSLVVKLISGVT